MFSIKYFKWTCANWKMEKSPAVKIWKWAQLIYIKCKAYCMLTLYNYGKLGGIASIKQLLNRYI